MKVARCEGCGEDVQCGVCERSDRIVVVERVPVMDVVSGGDVPADVRAAMEQARQARIEMEHSS